MKWLSLYLAQRSQGIKFLLALLCSGFNDFDSAQSKSVGLMNNVWCLGCTGWLENPTCPRRMIGSPVVRSDTCLV